MTPQRKKIFIFSLPAFFLLFVVFQNFSFFSPTAKPKRNISSVAVVQNNLASQVSNGTYYAFTANYECFDTQLKRKVSSYFDSYQIKNGIICHSGDTCQIASALSQTVTQDQCSKNLPELFNLNKNKNSFTIGKISFRKLAQSSPPECAINSCALLPTNCKYDKMPPLDDNGCAQGCGGIECTGVKPDCPNLKCAAPPQNCEYNGVSPLDANSCATGCGELKCDVVSEVKQSQCPDLKCAAAPENCHYDRSQVVFENACATSCGVINCQYPNIKSPTCTQNNQCAKAPVGCFYVGLIEKDENSCDIGCGSLVCPKQKVSERCIQPVCKPAPPNCRYDGSSPLDFDGCSTGCGQLNCTE